MFRSRIDTVFGAALCLPSLVAGSLVVLVVLFLCAESWPAIDALALRLVGDSRWQPEASGDVGRFGMLPMVVGTLAVTGGAVLLAAPLGIASAAFARFYSPPPVAWCYRRLVELLAGVPSVVYGLWGLVVLTPWISRFEPPGQSLLAGVLVVGLMILPTVMLLVEASFASVPRSLVEGAVALGLGRLSIVRRIVLPASRQGIATGVMLAATRAAGETMAVVMVCGNVVQIPSSVFDPVRTLTANIALEMGYALGMHRSALFASGLLLLVLSLLGIGTSEWLGRRR